MATAPSKPKKVSAAKLFEFMGESIELPAQQAYELRARYTQAGVALHAAKEVVKLIEDEIRQMLQGYEYGTVNGERIFNWPFVASTKFDMTQFKLDNPQLAAQYTTTNKFGSRRFSVPGTVGMD